MQEVEHDGYISDVNGSLIDLGKRSPTHRIQLSDQKAIALSGVRRREQKV